MYEREEVDALELRLRSSLVAMSGRLRSAVTLVEVVDDATDWSSMFDASTPLVPDWDFDELLDRAPLFVCSAAAEIGFRFEGVGTVFWAKLADALGIAIDFAQRARVADAFAALEAAHGISRPSESAFSAHFSIISWPIANALLPLELVASVARLLARAPTNTLPGPGRAPGFPGLRAWASAAEGARLVDWLRLEGPAARVLGALLTENRQHVLPRRSYDRLRDAISTSSEAFIAARAARARSRDARSEIATERQPGRLTASLDASGVRLYATWTALPPALYDGARAIARAAAWRPRLWGAGGFLHPDAALGAGPFALALTTTPTEDDAAYPDAAEVFGSGSDIAAALAARTIAWDDVLVFDPGDDRVRAEQRVDLPGGASGFVWVATKHGAGMAGLRRLGDSCGYAFFEADLADDANRLALLREGLTGGKDRPLVARHPSDAIGAPRGVVRPGRPFLVYADGHAGAASPETLKAGGRKVAVPGPGARPDLRCEPQPAAGGDVVDLILFERDAAFEALVERRLQLRVGSRFPLTDVLVEAELEVASRLVARGRDRLPSLPATVPGTSPLFAPLYEERVRAKLLEAGSGLLTISIGRSAVLHVHVRRPPATVTWTGQGPRLLGAALGARLVRADARHPHRFEPSSSIAAPASGAVAYALETSDGRLADPMRLLASSRFELGDLTARFGDDVGSRRMRDRGRGVGEIARARTGWARAVCETLPSVAARARVVRQFDEPLVIDLCGRPWSHAEQSTSLDASDPHAALFAIALATGLASIPPDCTAADQIRFVDAFRRRALLLDPGWPAAGGSPLDGAMDDALNASYNDAVNLLHGQGRLLDVDGDDCDFGSVAEEWDRAAGEALLVVRRQPLVDLLAPAAGARQLAERSYRELGVAELAEDLAAWTRRWALPRGLLDAEQAACSLLLWLSPTACDDIESTVRVLATDPFVARATRYAALRLEADGAHARA